VLSKRLCDLSSPRAFPVREKTRGDDSRKRRLGKLNELGTYVIRQPDSIGRDEEFMTLLVHLLGPDCQDDRFATARANGFRGIPFGGQMNVVAFPFL